MSPFRGSGRSLARALGLGGALLLATFLAVGFVGVERYGRNYWLYRGFPPPLDPAYVKEQGTEQHFVLKSPALGGRGEDVYVYLPPGYNDDPTKRYPVFYLLHGVPGTATSILRAARTGVVEDELVARGEAQPVILVMPSGSTGFFVDKEWANGVGRGEGWATYVSRDVVQAIDSRYRTIPSPAARAIGGLSEGGYGAINIALHHPGEFAVVESWSGYEVAAHDHAIFGKHLQGWAENTPLFVLPKVASALRRARTFFWFYSGTHDPFRKQNRQFLAELQRLRIPHQYIEFAGGHSWVLWRGQADRALLAASSRLTGG